MIGCSRENVLRNICIFVFDIRIARKRSRLDFLGMLMVWSCGLKKLEMISIIFSRRSNRSNIACREISNGYRNTKGNPLCFGNYEQLLGDLGEFCPKNHRPPKFERFDRPEKMIEIISVFF